MRRNHEQPRRIRNGYRLEQPETGRPIRCMRSLEDTVANGTTSEPEGQEVSWISDARGRCNTLAAEVNGYCGKATDEAITRESTARLVS